MRSGTPPQHKLDWKHRAGTLGEGRRPWGPSREARFCLGSGFQPPLPFHAELRIQKAIRSNGPAHTLQILLPKVTVFKYHTLKIASWLPEGGQAEVPAGERWGGVGGLLGGEKPQLKQSKGSHSAEPPLLSTTDLLSESGTF